MCIYELYTYMNKEHKKYKLSLKIVFTESTCFIPKLDVRTKIDYCEHNNQEWIFSQKLPQEKLYA